MNIFLFVNFILTGIVIFVLIYSYSLNFFDKEWQNKIKQDSFVGLTIIFSSMTSIFCWIIYLYFLIFLN